MVMGGGGGFLADGVCDGNRKLSRLAAKWVCASRRWWGGGPRKPPLPLLEYLPQERSTLEQRGIFFIAAQIHTDYFFNPRFRVLLAWNK